MNEERLKEIAARVEAYERSEKEHPSTDAPDERIENTREGLYNCGFTDVFADLAANSFMDIPFLLAEVKRLTAERDAAVEDLKRVPQVWPCFACKHTGKMSNRCHGFDRDCFEWRGVQEVAHETHQI